MEKFASRDVDSFVRLFFWPGMIRFSRIAASSQCLSVYCFRDVRKKSAESGGRDFTFISSAERSKIFEITFFEKFHNSVDLFVRRFFHAQ